MIWETFIDAEQKKPYYKKIVDCIVKDSKDGEIYPSRKNLFLAYKLCPIDKVRVCILGQDPYFNVGQAMGLSFSVPQNCLIPPSLRNIYKEIKNDIGQDIVLSHGCLERWAKEEGVFLLNSVLTVKKGFAASHKDIGWEEFTDATIKVINDVGHPVVFMLWGNFAKSKKMYITNKQHCVQEAAHPSPFSASNGFFGCKHFSKANEFLMKNGQTPIDWSIK